MGRTRPTIGNKQQRAKIWAREKTQKREEKDKRKEQRRKKRSRQHDLLRDGGELGEGLEREPRRGLQVDEQVVPGWARLWLWGWGWGWGWRQDQGRGCR